MFNLEEARGLCGTENEVITRHCQLRLEKRGILIAHVEYAIMHGEIIEEYPDDYPFPSCLIFCALLENRPLHVVCSVGGGCLYLITAYYPTREKFGLDYKTRQMEDAE